MLYRSLGKSSLRVSEIGFGCMSLEPQQSSFSQVVHKAIDAGINFFDTADLYDKGLNEEMLGNALKGKRDQVILASKAGNQWRIDGSGWDWNPRKAYLMSAIDKSLQRLQTDYIDLYQLHGGTIEDPIDEIIETFELLQQQGKIRFYGISSIRPNLIREYVNRSDISSVMMQYSLLDRRPEEACLDLLRQNNIGVLARGALAKGLLSDKPADPYLNYSKEEVVQVINTLKEISGTKKLSPDTAIQFVLENEAVSSAVIGIRTNFQLDEAVKSIHTKKLPADTLKILMNILPANYYESHR